MAVIKTQTIQSIIVFIIVSVVILWLFQDNILKISIFQKQPPQLLNSNEEFKEDAYLEKIDNFILKEYSKEQALLHIIEADTYFSYKDSPAQMFKVIATTFDDSQQEGLVLSSKRAEMHKSGKIFFNGEVNIQTKSGILHELDTESLMFLSNNGQIKSDTEVTYLGENEKIIAQGMDMSTDSDTMLLNGGVQINQDSSAIINTSNLFINHSKGEKIYQSKEKTIYLSKDHTVTSEDGINADMNKALLKLFGKVEILGLLGSTMKCKNLLIDQSNSGEIYKCNESVTYQSDTVNIRANKMYYDAILKKLELNKEVIAIYE